MPKHREVKLPTFFKNILLQNALTILLAAFGKRKQYLKQMGVL